MVLGLLAVVGKRKVASAPREFHREHRSERDSLVSRAKNHVEFDAACQQATRIELRQPVEPGAVVKQAGIEKVGADASSLGLELAKAQHATIDRELHEILRQRVLRRAALGTRCSSPADSTRHGDSLVQIDQPEPQRHPLGHSQRA